MVRIRFLTPRGSRRNSRTLTTPVALSLCLVLGGCATHTSPHTFNQSEVGRRQTVEMGTVYAVREVMIQNDARGVARITGAVLGGIAGSTIGGGNRANAAGAVAGAAAGGAVGGAAAARTRPGIEITVDLDSGLTVAVAQDGNIDQFRVGDRVRVASSGGTTRVTR